LTRPSAKGLRRGVLQSLGEVTLVPPLGPYAGKTATYGIDYDRVERVAERIARGLFFYHTGRVIPSTCRVKAVCLTGRRFSEDLRASLQRIALGLQEVAGNELGPGIFRYKFAFIQKSEHHPSSSVWQFSVYAAVEFLILVVDTPLTTQNAT
jgi:hypothetical protein